MLAERLRGVDRDRSAFAARALIANMEAEAARCRADLEAVTNELDALGPDVERLAEEERARVRREKERLAREEAEAENARREELARKAAEEKAEAMRLNPKLAAEEKKKNLLEEITELLGSS